MTGRLAAPERLAQGSLADRQETSTLIVTAHPDVTSLTHRASARLQETLGGGVVMAPLAQEGFDPRFTLSDRLAYQGQSPSARDVVAEQQRMAAVDQLVLVFPVYWWSMPAVLKGWIDRVFIEGWAFELDETGRVVPRLERLTVHLLPVTGTTSEAFARHGYAQALTTQIENGIIEFCGARPGVTAFIYDSESADAEAVNASMESAVRDVAIAITGGGARVPSVPNIASNLE